MSKVFSISGGQFCKELETLEIFVLIEVNHCSHLALLIGSILGFAVCVLGQVRATLFSRRALTLSRLIADWLPRPVADNLDIVFMQDTANNVVI